MTQPHLQPEGRSDAWVPTDPAVHLSTLTLHRYRYGELSGPALGTARRHLDGCTSCAARLQTQEQERAAFVLRPVPEPIRALARESRPSGAARWLRELAPFLLAAAAAVVVALAIPSSPSPEPDTSGISAPQIAYRGALPEVEAWVDLGGGPRPMREQDVLGEGDRVQLAYDPRGAQHVALAGRDGSGRIDIYTTEAPTGTGLVRAPFALTLDDAPGVQELFVVRSGVRLDEHLVRRAIASGAPGIEVARLAVRKED